MLDELTGQEVVATCRVCGGDCVPEPPICYECRQWAEGFGKEGCPVCHGEGYLQGWPDYNEPDCDATYTCPVCDGKGIVRESLAQWVRKQARRHREHVQQLESLLAEQTEPVRRLTKNGERIRIEAHRAGYANALHDMATQRAVKMMAGGE